MTKSASPVFMARYLRWGLSFVSMSTIRDPQKSRVSRGMGLGLPKAARLCDGHIEPFFVGVQLLQLF